MGIHPRPQHQAGLNEKSTTPMAVYKLSRTISSHANDVKAVRITSDGSVITASRDGKALVTSVDGNTRTLLDSSAFLNSLCTDSTDETVFIGSYDSTIARVNLLSDETGYYIGHTANISCLDYHSASNTLASGSWDHSIRVWNSPEKSIELTGHTQNVWDVKFVNEHRLLSASADRTIKLWDLPTGKAIKTFTGHDDVVRSLVILSDSEFVSASNDGTLRIWDLSTGKQTHVLTGHTSFIYSLAQLDSEHLISSGEDRSVRIWDLSAKKCVQTILLPSISQWSVAANDKGDFVVGSSDNSARVFTTSAERMASAEEQAEFEKLVENTAMGENEIDESELADASVLLKPGTQEGQVVMIRPEGKKTIEAHQFSNGVWSKIGDVVGQNQASGSKKVSFEGKQYDYVFDVDVSDTAPPLKLPYNNSENPYTVAEKFISDNNLPSSYTQNVVQFIIQNSQAKSLDAVAPPPQAQSKPPVPQGEVPEVLRYNQLVALKAFQPDPLLKALQKSAEQVSDNLIAYNVESLLLSLPSSGSELLTVALELKSKWQTNIDALVPIYDLIRIAIPNASSITPQIVWINLLDAIDGSLPKHTLLAIRGVANLLSRPDFDAANGTNKAMLQQAVQMVQMAVQSQTITKPLAIALSTLALNLAIHNPSNIDFASFLTAISPRITTAGDAEALYRLVLAIGLRSVASPTEALSYKASWFPANTEERTSLLLNEVLPRINK